MEPLLEVKDLRTEFFTKKGITTAVDGVSFRVDKGQTLGLVGESGCGKSVTSMSILRLLPEKTSRIPSGEILFDGKDLLKVSISEMQSIRGRDISMIFQDSLSALNPVVKVGKQIVEAVLAHQKMSRANAEQLAIDMLKRVGIPSPGQRAKEYPHQLSGGMRQRIMIAMALCCNAKLLIADEPTTALDVTIQAQILDLIEKIKTEGDRSVILITHDMGVIAEMTDQVAVMYAGKIMEIASTRELFAEPLHPYSRGLLESIPRPDIATDRLYAIPGTVPSPDEIKRGCRFCSRCDCKMLICSEVEPGLRMINNRQVRCHLYR